MKKDELLQACIQMFIASWADYKKESFTDTYIEYLKTTATATRIYMKELGEWDEDNEKESIECATYD